MLPILTTLIPCHISCFAMSLAVRRGISFNKEKWTLNVFHFLYCTLHVMPHCISHNIKIATVRLYERQLLDLSHILKCCSFS